MVVFSVNMYIAFSARNFNRFLICLMVTCLKLQIILSLYVISSTDVYLSNLGNLFGFGEIKLGTFGIPFTVFCVVGIMNAFNMIDGINGLCAGYAMMAFLFIGFYSGLI